MTTAAPADLPFAAPTHPYDGLPMVVISGVGRSGTTALRKSLGLHPRLHSTGHENNIVYDVLALARLNCTAPSRRFAMLVDDPTYDAHFRALLLGLLWPRPRTDPGRPDALLALSDLTPDRADYLVRLVPGVRIVYLVRNGIEVIASRLRYDGFRHFTFEQNCDTWSGAHDMARWGEPCGNFHLLRHERLLPPHGPERTLNELLSFLGLDPNPTVLAHLRDTAYHPTSEAKPTQTPAEILASRAERWADWSDLQRGYFERSCSATMEHFGYPVPWHAGAPVIARNISARAGVA